jgi:hypothetical protein
VKGGDGSLRRRRGASAAVALCAVTLSVLSGSLTGCTSSGDGKGGRDTPAATSPGPQVPSVDELAGTRAAVAARALLDRWTALGAGTPRLAALARQVVADHRAHLEALGAGVAAASAGTSPGASPTSGSPATLVAAERTAAEEALRDLRVTTPATAGLLARMAAARVVHADLLAAAARLPAPGQVGLPTGAASSVGASPAATSLEGATAAALSTLLAGEHAAVFAYGLVTARVADAREPLARSLWQAHLARRDALEARLDAAGLAPAEAAPAYDVGTLPAGPADAVALAARVEDGLASVAFGAVTTTTGATRLEAAADLVIAARRAATWRAAPTALPG